MATKYATLNVQMRSNQKTEEAIRTMKDFLKGAAHEADAEIFKVFYSAEKDVVGLSIPFNDEDALEIVEAGATLGHCMGQYENSDVSVGFCFWKSIDALDGTTLQSPI